jgi:tetratricopeptide (TPR) repeat protein
MFFLRTSFFKTFFKTKWGVIALAIAFVVVFVFVFVVVLVSKLCIANNSELYDTFCYWNAVRHDLRHGSVLVSLSDDPLLDLEMCHADFLADSEKYSEAIAIYKKTTDRDCPKSLWLAVCLSKRGDAELALQRWRDAEKSYKRAIALLEPLNPKFHLDLNAYVLFRSKLAIIYLTHGNADDCREIYRTDLNLARDCDNVLHLKASVLQSTYSRLIRGYLDNNDLPSALQIANTEFRDLNEKGYNNQVLSSALLDVGYANYKSGFYDKSIVNYKEAISRTSPHNGCAYALLGLDYAAMRCPSEAIIYARKSLELQPNQRTALDILRSSGDIGKYESL